MKLRFLLLYFILFSISTGFSRTSVNPNAKLPILSHLVEVNNVWANYKNLVPNRTVWFNSDADRIQYHLNATIYLLRTNTPANLSSSQLENRIALLDELVNYAAAKKFPMNTKYGHRQPCFVDEINTHCAVGYLMKTAGDQELVASIVESHNYDFLADIKTKGVSEWAYENGFSLDELKLIQPGYPPNDTYEQLGTGTNGEVKMIANGGSLADIIFCGDFTILDDLPCMNVGMYSDNTLSCIGDGLQGTVNGIIQRSGVVYAYGDLIHMGEHYPLARYEGGIWQFEALPAYSSAIATLGHSGLGSTKIELAISIPGYEGQQMWGFVSSGDWTRTASLDGKVYSITNSMYGRVYAGHFNSFVIHDPFEGDTEYISKNLIIKHSYLDSCFTINTGISDTIKCVKSIGNAIYLGGSAYLHSASDICLSRYVNGEMQTLLRHSDYYTGGHFNIKTLDFYEDSRLILGGEFYISPYDIGTHGDNLASFSVVSHHLVPMATFNRSVETVLKHPGNGSLYIGGKFDGDGNSDNLNHLVRHNSFAGIDDLTEDHQLSIFPNPVQNQVFVKGLHAQAEYTLFTITGQFIKTGLVTEGAAIPVEDLPKGHYLLHLKTAEKSYQLKMMK